MHSRYQIVRTTLNLLLVSQLILEDSFLTSRKFPNHFRNFYEKAFLDKHSKIIKNNDAVSYIKLNNFHQSANMHSKIMSNKELDKTSKNQNKTQLKPDLSRSTELEQNQSKNLKKKSTEIA